MLSSSRLPHPAPFTAAGRGTCPSTLGPGSAVWGQHRTGHGLEPAQVQGLARCCFLAEEQRVWQTVLQARFSSLSLPVPVGLPAQAAPSTPACATGVSLSLGPRGRAKLGPCPGSSAVPFLTGSFTGKRSQFLKAPSPNTTLALQLLAGQIPSFTAKSQPRRSHQHHQHP